MLLCYMKLRVKYSGILSLMSLVLLMLSCEEERLLPVVKLYPPKIAHANFKKDAVFFKWNIRKTSEEILGYRISYENVARKKTAERLVGTSVVDGGFELAGLAEGEAYKVKIQAEYGEYAGAWSQAVEGVAGKPAGVKNFVLKKNTQSADWFLDLAWNKNEANKEKRLTIVGYDLRCFNNATNKTQSMTVAAVDEQVAYNKQTDVVALPLEAGSYQCDIVTKAENGLVSDSANLNVEIATVEKPVFNAPHAPWGAPIRFVKSFEHTYTLTSDKGGVVRLTESTTSPGVMEVSATEYAADVVVEARRNGYAGKVAASEAITFNKHDQGALTIGLQTSVPWSTRVELHAAETGSGSGRVVYAQAGGSTANGAKVTKAGIVTARGPGTVMVSATKAADAQYNAKTSPVATITFTKNLVVTPSAPTIEGTDGFWKKARPIAEHDASTYEYRIHPTVSGVRIANGSVEVHAQAGVQAQNVRVQRRTKETRRYFASPWSDGSAPLKFTNVIKVRTSVVSLTGVGEDVEYRGPIIIAVYTNSTKRQTVAGGAKKTVWQVDAIELDDEESRTYTVGQHATIQTLTIPFGTPYFVLSSNITAKYTVQESYEESYEVMVTRGGHRGTETKYRTAYRDKSRTANIGQKSTPWEHMLSQLLIGSVIETHTTDERDGIQLAIKVRLEIVE